MLLRYPNCQNIKILERWYFMVLLWLCKVVHLATAFLTQLGVWNFNMKSDTPYGCLFMQESSSAPKTIFYPILGSALMRLYSLKRELTQTDTHVKIRKIHTVAQHLLVLVWIYVVHLWDSLLVSMQGPLCCKYTREETREWVRRQDCSVLQLQRGKKYNQELVWLMTELTISSPKVLVLALKKVCRFWIFFISIPKYKTAIRMQNILSGSSLYSYI